MLGSKSFRIYNCYMIVRFDIFLFLIGFLAACSTPPGATQKSLPEKGKPLHESEILAGVTADHRKWLPKRDR